LRDHYTELSGKNYAIVGVSADNELSHAAFAAQHQLPFSLLADVDLAIIKAYDVWGLKDIAGRVFEGIVRTTFIISSDGVIKRVLTHPKTAGHAQEVLSLKT
jgi:peroxiredoxin Q/BCP